MRSLIIAFLLAGTLPLFANGEGGDTIRIDEVVVSGNRIEVARANTPVSITVIGSDVISSQEESNILPVVAKTTPSVFISEIGVGGYSLGNGTSGQLTIRGVGGSPNARVMTMVDGQPQYMGIFGHPLPNFHVASNVERVEVVRGPASLLYGSNAMGGVINVITRKEVNNGFSFRGHGSYGSFNSVKSGAAVNYGKEKFSFGLSFNHDQTQGHRDTSAFRIDNLNLHAAYEINTHWNVRMNYMLADYSFEDPGSDQNPEDHAFWGDISRHMATLSLKNEYEGTQGGVYAFYNWGKHSFSDGWESRDLNSGINIFQSFSLWRGGTLTGGSDLKYYGGEGSIGFYPDTFLRVHEAAAYILANQRMGKVLNLSVGARYENHSDFGGEFVPQAGLSIIPCRGTTIKGLVSKGFRSPTIMELYLFMPNPDLGPERLWNYEVSVMQRLGSFGVSSLTAYTVKGSNLLIMQPNPNPGPPNVRINGGEFKNWGIEFESSFRPVQNLRFDMNYSYLNTDMKMYFAPTHQFYMGGIYKMNKLRFSLNLKTIAGLYTYIDPENSVNDLEEAYNILNLKVSYQLHDMLELYVSGKNLLNQKYQTVFGYPMPGLTVLAGFSVNIK